MARQTKYHTPLLSELPVVADDRDAIIGVPVDSVEEVLLMIANGNYVSATADICAQAMEVLRARWTTPERP